MSQIDPDLLKDVESYVKDGDITDTTVLVKVRSEKNGVIIENEKGECRKWNGNFADLAYHIAKYDNRFNLDKTTFESLPHESVDYKFTFEIDVRASQGENEEQVCHWLMNKIHEIPDVIEVNEK